MNYNTKQRIKTILFLLAVAAMVTITIVLAVNLCRGEETLATVYAMCKPGSHVTIRMTPSKDGVEAGRLDCGDSFQTDAETRDGWLRCYGAGEGGWVYLGYVATEPVQAVGQRYVCVAKKQVACRRWINGPQIEDNKGRRQWLKNGQTCEVFVTDGEWAVTSRGYIKIEYLDPDPE